MDWQAIIGAIEDRVFPHYECDIRERGLYYYLLRQSRLRGSDSVTVPLSQISMGLQCSEYLARKAIRSLAKKGCIELEQTRHGHRVRPLLPQELKLPDSRKEAAPVDIESVDFFKDRAYLAPLLERERQQCFYCLRHIGEEEAELDHVVSQLNGGGNGYRNIVAACHNCNSKKQGGRQRTTSISSSGGGTSARRNSMTGCVH